MGDRSHRVHLVAQEGRFHAASQEGEIRAERLNEALVCAHDVRLAGRFADGALLKALHPEAERDICVRVSIVINRIGECRMTEQRTVLIADR